MCPSQAPRAPDGFVLMLPEDRGHSARQTARLLKDVALRREERPAQPPDAAAAIVCAGAISAEIACDRQ